MITASEARELCGFTKLVEKYIDSKIKAAARAKEALVVLSFDSNSLANQVKVRLENNGFTCKVIFDNSVLIKW